MRRASMALAASGAADGVTHRHVRVAENGASPNEMPQTRGGHVLRAHRYRRFRRLHQRSSLGAPARTGALFLATPVLLALLGSVVGAFAIATSYYSTVSANLTPPEDAIAARGGGARIYDRTGTLLYEFLDPEYGHQEPVALDAVSPWVVKATIAAEDASFYSNPGINVKGLTRAAIENFKPGDGFLQGTGGSSITQQLVKQLYFDMEERQERSVSRKLKEAALALEITQRYEKDQILEWYLNEIPYGGVLTGIEAAARGYFGIHASEVTMGQAAFLAGLPQSPGEYDPFTNMPAAIERQHEVLDLMAKHGEITQEDANWAKLEVLELKPAPQPFLAPHFVNYVGDYIKATLGEEALLRGGLEVHTTLDLALNTRVNEILEANLQAYEDSTQGHNGAVVIINPPTGRILAMVGSRDYFREDIDGTVNNALGLNSPGSTLKPFTYATAFKEGWGPDWPIIDSAITYKEVDGKTFSPRNPDGRNRGVMPLKQALGNSFNIPAFKTALWVGVDDALATAKSMGISTLDRDLGPAFTLGGVDVKLLDMVYAYSTFANNGVMAGTPATAALPAGNRQLDPVPVEFVENRFGEVVLDNRVPSYATAIGAEYAYMVTEILSNDENRQITYGRGSNLNIPGHRVAVKTGTSEPFESKKLIGDTWTIGYTPDVAVGVWVGNSDNTPMVNIFSTTIAGRTWHDSILRALEGLPARDWIKPAGIVEATVCVPSGIRVTEGVKCPSVKGMFAEAALAAQDDRFWGGEELSEALPLDQRAAKVPGEINDLKRTLAEEYLRGYRSGGGGTRAPAPPPAQPTPAEPAPAPTVVPTDAVPPPQPPAPQAEPRRNKPKPNR